MGEKTGFLMVLVIFGAFIVPILIGSFISHWEGSQVLTVSTEMQQLVSAEGGLTPKVQQAIDNFGSKGLAITLTDSTGAPLTGKAPVGETIKMTYEFNDFKTENQTIVLTR